MTITSTQLVTFENNLEKSYGHLITLYFYRRHDLVGDTEVLLAQITSTD